MTSKTTKDNSKKKRILIVDDESDVDIVLKRVFGQSGFNVDSYDDPILALENFKAGSYGLILLDIKMPEMDGFNLYQKMKKIDTKIKVCFLTASVIKHTVVSWSKMGIKQINSPIDPYRVSIFLLGLLRYNYH